MAGWGGVVDIANRRGGKVFRWINVFGRQTFGSKESVI